jgi:hypothetical protein
MPLVLGLVTGACARYQPEPINPTPYSEAYRTRRLDDSALVRFVTEYTDTPVTRSQLPGNWRWQPSGSVLRSYEPVPRLWDELECGLDALT